MNPDNPSSNISPPKSRNIPVPARLSPYLRERRLLLEKDAQNWVVSIGFISIKLKYMRVLYSVLKRLLKILGLWRSGLRHSIEYVVQHQKPCFDKLPGSFHGYRILHLSDLHIEAIVDKGTRLGEIVGDLKYDLCVITGDFRYAFEGAHDKAIEALRRLISRIQCPGGIIGILGNHDSLAFGQDLENLGIKMLINESTVITKDGESIRVVGVDDPHCFKTYDLDKALQGVGSGEFKLFLAHSPEIIPEAQGKGMDYYLCGHAHGGQICLPGGKMIFGNAKCSREFVSRAWQYKGMSGYTSHGSGASGVPVRYFSHPEVTIHELQANGVRYLSKA